MAHNHEYEYKIDARTGAIVGTKKKLDIFRFFCRVGCFALNKNN